jgi:septum formation protein
MNKSAAGPVLAADTAVVLEGVILGKAETEAQAREMLGQLSGRSHEVYSGVALIAANGHEGTALSITRVQFRRLAEAELSSYCRGGEPIGKAGGYAIQGHAAAFIEKIEGSYSGVMGLPLYETAGLLAATGIAVL